MRVRLQSRFTQVFALTGALLAAAAGCAKEEAAGSAPAAGAAAQESPPPLPPGADRPYSVLVLTVDTLRPDYLSQYGYDRPTSPYLDELLAEAFHFERAATPVPRTTPALASLMTGAYPHTTGVRKLMDTLAANVTPMAEAFRQDGYQTVAVVTNHVLRPERGLDRGFDIYDHAKDFRSAEETTAAALKHLESADPDEPLFAWVHYIDPHMPYQAPPELIREFDPGYEGRYRDHFGEHHGPAPRPEGQRGPYPDDLPKAEAVFQNPLPDEVNAHIRRLYAADVRRTDDALRAVVERARELAGGELILVFTSDHGESLGEHDYYYDHGDYVYNATLRVPLAILLPEHHFGYGAGRNADWVSLVDLAPTVMELAGVRPPAAMASQFEGRSLTPLIHGNGLPARPVFAECGHSHFFDLVRGRAANTVTARFRAACLGDWKLIWAPGHEDDALAWQLYDVAADPHETHDLYRPDHPQAERLKESLRVWYQIGADAPEAEERELTAEERATLNELGYVADE